MESFEVGVMECWSRLSREIAEFLSLEIFWTGHGPRQLSLAVSTLSSGDGTR